MSCFSCHLLHEDASVTVLVLSGHAVEIIDFLAENFKIRFKDFYSHATNVQIFENQFSVMASDAALLSMTVGISLQFHIYKSLDVPFQGSHPSCAAAY